MSLALLFDLDGTLIDSDPLHAEVFMEILADHGRAISREDYFDRMHGRHNPAIFRDALPGLDPHALSDAKEARFRDRLPARMPPATGLLALLDRAGAAGWSTAVVTNAPRANALAMLAALGLADRFATLVIGGEVEAPKPAPAPYRAAMAALGARPDDAIAFEDSPSGLRAARAAGAYVVGLRSSLSEDRLREAGAHMTIADFADPALDRLLAARGAPPADP